MNRTPSTLVPALSLALLIVVASVMAAAAPRMPWAAVAGAVLLALGLVAIDLVQRRRLGRSRPSAGALILAAAILLACGMIAAGDLDRLAGLIPILGAGAVPIILRPKGAPSSCGRA